MRSAIADSTITITTRPLAGDDLPRLWEILREFPRENFDDSGPTSIEEFEESMVDRVQHELLIAFDVAGELVGATAVEPVSYRNGMLRGVMLRGVCFARAVHSTGVPLQAMRGAIAKLYEDGIEKISARMFADNLRAWRFFQKLGAVEEGLQRAETVRAGELVDVRLIALFRES